MRHVPDPEFPLSNILHRIPTGFYNSYWRLYEREAYACRIALRYIQQIGEGEFIPMAKRKSTTANFGVDFINVEMTDKHEADFTEWWSQAFPKLGELTAELCSDGNKIGVSFDGDNECFIVSVTCKDEGSDNHNRCFTSRSDEWTEALGIALYKWDVIFKRSTWEGKSRRNNWG